MKQLLSSILFLFIAVTGFSQPLTEGKVVYEISYPDTSLDALTISMLPTEATLYFKGDKTRMEMKMGLGMNMIAIADNKAMTTTVLMDIMGNKSAMTMTDEDLKKASKKEDEYEIVTTAETKMIAGLPCKKAVVTLKDKNSFNVWYTDGIKVKNSNWNNQFKNIDGFLMEFRMDQTLGLSMLMTAKSIADVKTTEQLFAIPEGYKTINSDEMMKMYSGKGNR